MNGAASASCGSERSASEPSSQWTISEAAKGFGARLSTSAVSALAKLDTARPARIRVMEDEPAPASAWTSKVAAKAPASAISGSASGKAADRPV